MHAFTHWIVYNMLPGTCSGITVGVFMWFFSQRAVKKVHEHYNPDPEGKSRAEDPR